MNSEYDIEIKKLIDKLIKDVKVFKEEDIYEEEFMLVLIEDALEKIMQENSKQSIIREKSIEILDTIKKETEKSQDVENER